MWSGMFELGMEQFDSGLALVNMSDAEKLNDLSGPTGIRLRLDDLFNARPVATSWPTSWASSTACAPGWRTTPTCSPRSRWRRR